MTIVLIFILLMMFVYTNTLFYSMVLLIVVTGLIFILFSNLMLHSLTGLMFLIVYIGAMMILIGYICAICPNLILSSSEMNSYFFIFVILISFLCLGSYGFSSSNVTFSPLVSYFYSYSGFVSFLTLIFMLFVTLLMVTSQYMVPKGPFRSVTI
nr:NADH dehydrogenase subunit 6 [Brachionus falcatus]